MNIDAHKRRRIAIVGATGCGKTSLANRLSARLHIPQVDLDVLFWDPGWTQAPVEVFRQRVDAALPPSPEGAWIVGGNYRMVRDLVWGRANTLVWLDYPLPLVFFRLLRRTIRRIISHEELFNGNYETFSNTFLSRNSLLIYLFQSYPSIRKTYPAEIAQPEYSHLEVVRLRRPGETAEWEMNNR